MATSKNHRNITLTGLAVSLLCLFSGIGLEHNLAQSTDEHGGPGPFTFPQMYLMYLLFALSTVFIGITVVSFLMMLFRRP